MSISPVPAPSPAFPGFDTSAYPGDAHMSAWKKVSPYAFVAYYLKSPCHHDGGWMGKRATLAAMGWNFLPVYVGQQVVGASRCGNNILTADQGTIDAQDAADRLNGDAFAEDTYVYLDVERCDVLPQGMKDYVRAWMAAIVDAGFSPGVYCHKHNAADIRDAVSAGLSDGSAAARFWIVGGVTANFDIKASKPSDSGIAFADLWQRPEPVSRTFGGIQILIDEDVSSFADPSAPIPT